MSANRRGVLVLKLTKAEPMAGEAIAALASFRAVSSSALGPCPPWSSRISLNPPVVPMPRTAGGWMIKTSAPVTDATRDFRSARICLNDIPSRARSLNDRRIR